MGYFSLLENSQRTYFFFLLHHPTWENNPNKVIWKDNGEEKKTGMGPNPAQAINKFYL